MNSKNKIFSSVIFMSIWTNLFYQIIKIKENSINENIDENKKIEINNSELNKRIDKLNQYFSF